jgi:hypothetical protein
MGEDLDTRMLHAAGRDKSGLFTMRCRRWAFPGMKGANRFNRSGKGQREAPKSLIDLWLTLFPPLRGSVWR